MHEIQVSNFKSIRCLFKWEVGYTQEPEYVQFIDKLKKDEP